MSEDRRFYGILLLVFGPLFVAGGWLAAFTDVGALLIFGGTAMLLLVPFILWSARAGVLSVALLAASWGWPWLRTL